MEEVNSVLEQSEAGNPEPLLEWVRVHGPDSKVGEQSIVWMAAICGNHHSLRLLLNLEHYSQSAPMENDGSAQIQSHVRTMVPANPNTRSSEGMTPLHYCCQNGYTECVSVLLACPNIEVNATTTDHVLYIGQSLPVYSPGGQTPLFFAVEAGYQEIVQLLLEVPTVLVSSPDLSLGTVYDLALERYAMVDNQIMKNAFKEILQLLAPHFNVSAQDIKYIDDKEAKERRKERERRLRERISVAKQLEEQKKHHQNQELVDRNYTPLNFNLFAGILNDEAFHPEFVGAMKSCDFSEVVFEPLKDYGVFTFPFLSMAFCKAMVDEMINYEKSAKERPDLVPIYYRHDGNLGSLEHCGWTRLITTLLKAVNPILAHCLPDLQHAYFQHAFLTRNFVGRAEMFKKHRDKSDLTINICLEYSDDCKGSTVKFFAPFEDQELAFEYSHHIGRVVIHSGAQWHQTTPILQGTRKSLIIWALK